jgi:LmbE family N-acetylglucosaminyl deacetylase
MASRVLVLSPHLDDAMLSCWHLLTGPDEVTVLNVFAGAPEAGFVAWWDRLTGASDSAERMRERRAEDHQAFERVAASSEQLDLLDEQYRRNGSPAALPEALAGPVRDADVVYAPANLFPVVDHGLVLMAALALRDDVRVYADLPHAAVYGLPEWVTGEHDALDVGGAWGGRLALAGLDPGSLRPQVHALDEDEFTDKLAALRCYRTQLPAIEREVPLERLRWEVTWTR